MCRVGKFSRRSTQLKVSRRFWLGDSFWLTSRSCVMLGTGLTSSSSLWREFSMSIITTVTAVTRNLFGGGEFLPSLRSLSFLSFSLTSSLPSLFPCLFLPQNDPQIQIRDLGSAVSSPSGKNEICSYQGTFSGSKYTKKRLRPSSSGKHILVYRYLESREHVCGGGKCPISV